MDLKRVGSGPDASPELMRVLLPGLVLLVLGLATGCGPAGNGGGAASGEGRGSYGEPPPMAGPATPPAPARPVARTPVVIPTNATLAVLQTELFPATLWRSSDRMVRIFGNLGASGLGGPSFLAYSSPTGITALRPGTELRGADLRENWLLAGFAGASGWTNWDSPWAVFLQRRPARVSLDTNGVEILFDGSAGHFSIMPLYGYEKLPQKDREFDVGKGPGAPRLRGGKGRDPKLFTWEWPLAVARDPLTRLRYWAGATRRFPVGCEDLVSVDRSRDTVTLRQRFNWIEVPDEWGTVPIRIAPVSPTLGLTLLSGERFPVSLDSPPFDFGIATPYGPFFGIPDADGYDVRLPVLQYVHATEALSASLPADAPAVALAALDKVRVAARSLFAKAQSEPGRVEELGAAEPWVMRALPWFDAATRTQAVALLGRHFREVVLVPARFQEREIPEGSGRRWLVPSADAAPGAGRSGEGEAAALALLEQLGAYVQGSGDHALVRERWDLIRRLFVVPARMRWVGFGRDGAVELGPGAAASLAFARLAYLAGDLDDYQHACGVFARELVHLHVKQRSARWFRERQPWHSMEPLAEEIYLTRVLGETAGWQMDGPRHPMGAAVPLSDRRWAGFQDPDVARFFRDHLGAEVRQEWGRLRALLEPGQGTVDDGSGALSLLRLESLLLAPSPTNRVPAVAPDPFAGPEKVALAGWLAVLRLVQPQKLERLIPAAPSTPFATGISRDVPGPNPHLVQSVWGGQATTAGTGRWPRIGWSGWKTPGGDRWNFGEIQIGDRPAPPTRVEVPVSWNTVLVRFEGP